MAPDAEQIIEIVTKTLYQVQRANGTDAGWLRRVIDAINEGAATWTHCPLCDWPMPCLSSCPFESILTPVTTGNPGNGPITTPEAIHALPNGTIVRDARGEVFMINRPRKHDGTERWPGEVWLDRFSDEYAVILRENAATGNINYPLTVIPTP